MLQKDTVPPCSVHTREREGKEEITSVWREIEAYWKSKLKQKYKRTVNSGGKGLDPPNVFIPRIWKNMLYTF